MVNMVEGRNRLTIAIEPEEAPVNLSEKLVVATIQDSQHLRRLINELHLDLIDPDSLFQAEPEPPKVEVDEGIAFEIEGPIRD